VAGELHPDRARQPGPFEAPHRVRRKSWGIIQPSGAASDPLGRPRAAPRAPSGSHKAGRPRGAVGGGLHRRFNSISARWA
jgi:hypothetical protein